MGDIFHSEPENWSCVQFPGLASYRRALMIDSVRVLSATLLPRIKDMYIMKLISVDMVCSFLSLTLIITSLVPPWGALYQFD